MDGQSAMPNQYEESNRESLSRFIEKLNEKKQRE
jgi:hypothetical protein